MKVNKTIKLYMNGAFPRTESGRSYALNFYNSEEVYAELCQASRKDFRNAIEIAKEAQAGWVKRSAYNRSQILYRMAEMTEGKRDEFAKLFQDVLGYDEKRAQAEVSGAIDSFVYYAGFCDKYPQMIGAVNPVNAPFHNFTTPEATGVVTLIDSDNFSFEKLVDRICSLITSGNAVVVLLGKGCPAVLAPLAEVFATSDLPAGVVNLLTGFLSELKDFVGTHMDVKSISYHNENMDIFHQLKVDGVTNMKRVVKGRANTQSLENILDFVEYKTVWHPIGI